MMHVKRVEIPVSFLNLLAKKPEIIHFRSIESQSLALTPARQGDAPRIFSGGYAQPCIVGFPFWPARLLLSPSEG
jgi:hypothetical protein